MGDCRKCLENIPGALYGELTDDQEREFKAHLNHCPACAAEYEGLKTSLEVMGQRVRNEPGPEFWDGYWEKLASRIEREEHRAAPAPVFSLKRLTGPLISLPKWAWQIAAAVLFVALGVLLGRMVLRSPGPSPQLARHALTSPAGTQAADILRAQNYFERSKVVLLAMVNFDPKTKDSYGLDFPGQKKVSKDLVREASYLKTQFKSPVQKRLKDLVSELEVILLQIANLDGQQEIAAVDLVKRGLDESAILFKISVSEIWRDARSKKNDNPKI
jgi:hypothetical protein